MKIWSTMLYSEPTSVLMIDGMANCSSSLPTGCSPSGLPVRAEPECSMVFPPLPSSDPNENRNPACPQNACSFRLLTSYQKQKPDSH